MFDIIGDIHGYADHLEALLKKMGYSYTNGVYSHSERKIIFVGDYIDRGPKIRETLKIVRKMVENEKAIALMGNHEYNALCFQFRKPDGGHLRKHSISNIIQHYKTLEDFKYKQKEYDDYLEWFKSLPLFFETEDFRVVHACWDENKIDYLRKNLENDRLNNELIYQSVNKETALYEAVEVTLKGKELKLPEAHIFTDHEGTERKEIRIKWWENAVNQTYKSVCVEHIETLPNMPLPTSSLNSHQHYTDKEKKVFFGHYWLNGEPGALKQNVCCLDYSVAKGGNLVAYRMNGEIHVDNRNIVYV